MSYILHLFFLLGHDSMSSKMAQALMFQSTEALIINLFVRCFEQHFTIVLNFYWRTEYQCQLTKCGTFVETAIDL